MGFPCHLWGCCWLPASPKPAGGDLSTLFPAGLCHGGGMSFFSPLDDWADTGALGFAEDPRTTCTESPGQPPGTSPRHHGTQDTAHGRPFPPGAGERARTPASGPPRPISQSATMLCSRVTWEGGAAPRAAPAGTLRTPPRIARWWQGGGGGSRASPKGLVPAVSRCRAGPRGQLAAPVLLQGEQAM